MAPFQYIINVKGSTIFKTTISYNRKFGGVYRQWRRNMFSSQSKPVLRDFRDLCGELGRINASLYALHKLLLIALKGRVRIYKYYFVAQPVTRASLVPPGRGRKIQMRMIDENNAVTSCFPRPREIIQMRFRQGAKCLAAFKDDVFIGYLWLLATTYQEDEVRASFSPLPSRQAVWDFDVYVKPEHRLGLTFPRLWDEANRYLADQGIRWSCSRIDAFNAGSLNSHARLGTKPLGSAFFICAGKWQGMFSTVAPYFHFSTNASSFPAFRFDTAKPGRQNPEMQAKTTVE
jgi:hypothetical protein